MSAYRVSQKEPPASPARFAPRESSMRRDVKQLAIPGALFATFVAAYVVPNILYLVGVLYLALLVIPSIIATVLVLRGRVKREPAAPEPAVRVRVGVGEESEAIADEQEADDRRTIASWESSSQT